MHQVVIFLSTFLLVISMIIPVYAAVQSVSLEKGFYTNEESLVFVGEEQEGKKSVFVIIRGPGGDFIGMVSDPASDNDGLFSTIPRQVDVFFETRGTYNATAFTDDQKESEGVSIELEYDGNRVSQHEDFVLTLKPIEDKTITKGQTLSFKAAVTDSSLDRLFFSLEKNPPSGASINNSTGQFTWTPSASQGNAVGVQYNFDIVVERGAQKDNEPITITVKDPVVTQPGDNSKDDPKTNDEPKELGIASFTATMIMSPTRAYLLLVPPNTRIHSTRFAPLLSATSNLDCI